MTKQICHNITKLCIAVMVMGLISVSAYATTEYYNNLGDFVNVVTTFWNTTAHTQVSVDSEYATIGGVGDFRPAAEVNIYTPAEFDPRAKTIQEALPIGFRSDKVIGTVLFLR